MTSAAYAVRRLLVVAAALALIGYCGVDLAPRLVAAGTSVAPAVATGSGVGRPAPSRPAAESQPVDRGASVRTVLAAAVPTGSTEKMAGPGSSPLLAPHLVARPVARPPTPVDTSKDGGGASGRAPPAPTGT